MASNPDFDEGQRAQPALATNNDGAASEGESVAVPSREEINSDSSDSDDGAVFFASIEALRPDPTLRDFPMRLDSVQTKALVMQKFTRHLKRTPAAVAA